MASAASKRVWEVMAINRVSKQDDDDGCLPTIVLEPMVVVAFDRESAVAMAIAKGTTGTPITPSNQWEWLVRPFVG